MTKAELQAEIDKVENEIFLLDMQDNWSNGDFEYNNRLCARRNALKAELEGAE